MLFRSYAAKKKRRYTQSSLQVKEENLAIVVIDTLATWAQGWVSEERFAQKLQLSAKQVHRTLKALQRAGFVVLEERREKVNRDKVESVADYEEVCALRASSPQQCGPAVIDRARSVLCAAQSFCSHACM